MSGISDELLMAYVDGELDGAKRASVEAYLASTPEGVERLRVFQQTGRGLSDLFDQPMREPVPQRLLDAVNQTTGVIAFDASKRRRPLRLGSAWPAALAASVTFLAAVGGAYWFARQSAPAVSGAFGVEVASSGEYVVVHPVAVILDTTASETQVPSSIDGRAVQVMPVFTFATESGGFCRKYTITAPDASAYGGVACKSANGRWRVEAYEAFASARAPEGKIAPAAGKAGPKSVEAAVDRLIKGDVLGAEAESTLMARGWRPAN